MVTKGVTAEERLRDPFLGRSTAGSETRSHWLGQVFVDQGWCWVTDFVETCTTNGKQKLEARPLCLGSEHEIVPVLKGQKSVPDNMHPRQRRALLEITGGGGQQGTGSDRHDSRTQGFSFRQRTGRSFRGDHRYRT